jgi:hypothetical protein
MQEQVSKRTGQHSVDPAFLFQKFHTDGFRSIRVCIGKRKFAFGIYRWPWFRRWYFYNTTLGQIIDDLGFIDWLIHIVRKRVDGYKIANLRILCVGIGVATEVSHDPR